MCIRNGITMSPVGNRRGAVFRVPLFRRRGTRPGSSEARWQGGYGSTHTHSRQFDNSVFLCFEISQIFADMSQSR